MKRHILSLLALIAFVLNSNAQTVVFQEDFDLAPLGVTCTSRGGSTLPQANPVPAGQWCWNDTTAISTSAPNSYHAATPLSSDTVVFESNSFSTVGNTFVQLSFFHKALMFGSMRAEIEVSNDNGATWILLGSTQYLGTSSSYPTLGYFNIPPTRSTHPSGELPRLHCPHHRQHGNSRNLTSPPNLEEPMALQTVRFASPTEASRETSCHRLIGASLTDGSWTMWKYWLLLAR